MKLFSLLKNLNARVLGSTTMEISGLYHKDTEVKEGGMFFCLHGTRVDGSDYVLSAINNGAVAVVTEQELQNLTGVTQIIVKNAREAMSILSCRFFGNPASKLKLVGVTGTNGKTTTSSMIAKVLEKSGKKVGLIGTNGVFLPDAKFSSSMTTPDPIELQKYLQIMVKNKVEFVIMEVSAHAIDLCKIEGFVFDAVVFTNLSEDHLDYFKTMENYFLTKAKLFSRKHAAFAAINLDDSYGVRLAGSINLPFVTYSKSNNCANFYSSDITLAKNGQTFLLNGKFPISLNMAGSFNVSNALAAISVLEHFGISEREIVVGLSEMQAVEGRFNTMLLGGVLVVVDYAHTPDGLMNILSSCREIAGKHKLISVFGCGGNREVEKRKIMGSISTEIADFTIITTDNPRFEKREKIAEDIARGAVNTNYKIELDRAKAIAFAVSMASENDVVVVAGKGAEPYIEENGEKMPYSDITEIEQLRRKYDE